MHLRNHEIFKKMKHKNFTLGVFVRGFCLGGFLSGGSCRGGLSGGFVLEPLESMLRRTRLTPRSSMHSLKIRMTSHPCNKYEQIMLSCLLSVN